MKTLHAYLLKLVYLSTEKDFLVVLSKMLNTVACVSCHERKSIKFMEINYVFNQNALSLLSLRQLLKNNIKGFPLSSINVTVHHR